MQNADAENGYGTTNCYKLKSALPWRAEYLYVDTPSHRADKLFIRARLPVRFRKAEFGKDGCAYVIVFCRFPRKREEDFLACMADLEKALLLEGHGDYRAACADMLSMLEH